MQSSFAEYNDKYLLALNIINNIQFTRESQICKTSKDVLFNR